MEIEGKALRGIELHNVEMSIIGRWKENSRWIKLTLRCPEELKREVKKRKGD